jgi:hypothetical protein
MLSEKKILVNFYLHVRNFFYYLQLLKGLILLIIMPLKKIEGQ